MSDIRLRPASVADVATIVTLVRQMLVAMTAYGGAAPATDGQSWIKVRDAVRRDIEGGEACYILAGTGAGEVVGLASGEIITLGGVFAPERTMHVSTLYVDPSFRRRGLGGRLLGQVLAWGREQRVTRCTLNVLVANPARELYRAAGFEDLEMKMSLDFAAP